MKLATLIQRLLNADRLETIASARQEIDAFAAAHPEAQNRAHPIWTAAGAMKRTEDALRAIEESGASMEAFYKQRDQETRDILFPS